MDKEQQQQRKETPTTPGRGAGDALRDAPSEPVLSAGDTAPPPDGEARNDAPRCDADDDDEEEEAAAAGGGEEPGAVFFLFVVDITFSFDLLPCFEGREDGRRKGRGEDVVCISVFFRRNTMGKGDDTGKEKKEQSLPVKLYLVLYNLAAAAG